VLSKLIPLLLNLVIGVIFWSLRETRSPTGTLTACRWMLDA
jgi:hypothetical protein